MVSCCVRVRCIARRMSSSRPSCLPSCTKPRSAPAASGARSIESTCVVTRRVMKVIRPEDSVAENASGSRRRTNRARSSLRLRSRSQSAMKAPKSICLSLASTGPASRKFFSMNSPSFSAMRCWLLWMIAVCGIGKPKRPLEQRHHGVPVGEPADGRGFGEGRDEAEDGMDVEQQLGDDEQRQRAHQHQRRQRLDALQLCRARSVGGGESRQAASKLMTVGSLILRSVTRRFGYQA